MMDLTVGEIAAACGGKLVPGRSAVGGADAETKVSSVVIDSRLAEPRGVFIAVQGERADGHRFVSDVFAQGAALAVVQKTPEQVEQGAALQWGSYILVEDTLQALKDIAEAYRKKLSVKVVGITGSVGKTSTKEFVACVLAEKYCVLKTEGNFNNEIGVPLTLLRIRPEHEVAVVEMGISEFGEMHRLSKMVRPDVCVVTNIGQSHLNNLKSRDGILRAKSEIFDFMARDGEICLNGEDDKLAPLEEIRGRRPHFYGLGGNQAEETVLTDIVSRGLKGSDARLKMSALPAEEAAVHIPLPGKHMALNAAAAACVARLFGLGAEDISAGIAKAAAVSGRTHMIETEHHTIIDDCYNANPVSMKAALELLALADTERVAILGDMLNLGEDSPAYHAEVGRQAAEAGIERIICVGEESRHMFRAAADHAADAGRVSYFPDRHALLKTLAEKRLPEGSTVLIKASHDMGFAELVDFMTGIPPAARNAAPR